MVNIVLDPHVPFFVFIYAVYVVFRLCTVMVFLLEVCCFNIMNFPNIVYLSHMVIFF